MPINSFLYPAPSTPTFAYNVANSVRFNAGDSPGFTKSTSTPTSRRKFTFSTWVKKADDDISDNQALFSVVTDSNNFLDIRFHHSEVLEIIDYASSTQMRLRTSRVFRDPSAWVHIVVRVDTTDGTADDRIKFYINGTEQTSVAERTNPSTNYDTGANNSNTRVGYQDSQYYFDGYLAETVFIDGQALDATSFGEFDSDSPNIWKPIDVSGLTFGNNGFYLDYESSSNLGNDANGGTDFTANNLAATDQTTDTCTNNFCTLNPLDATSSTTNTFSEGNTQMIGNNSTNRRYGSTFAVNKGKWYFEFKQGGSVSSGGACVGIFDIDATNTQSTTFFGLDSNALQIQLQSGSGNVRIYNGSFSTDNYGSSASVGDIIMVALDMDNYFMYVGQNGTFLNSGNPLSGSSGTGNINNAGGNVNFSLSGKTFMFGGGVQNTDFQQWNFGNPSFSISSGNADDNGYGNFEYDVPAGYYALNTKNLAEFG